MSKTQLFLWEGVAVRIVEDPRDYEFVYLDDEGKAWANSEVCRDVRQHRRQSGMPASWFGLTSRATEMHERINRRAEVGSGARSAGIVLGGRYALAYIGH